MKQKLSIGVLESRRDAKLKQISEAGPMIQGSLATIGVTCGNPNCKCARGEKHASHILNKKVGGKTHRWAWLTSIRPGAFTIEKLTDKGGRLRWKIENEGFNQLKNGGTGLKHDYGSIGNAWYNYYLLAQIVMLLVQLTWHGDIARKLTGEARCTTKELFRTIINMVEQFRLSLQIHRLSEVVDGINPALIQIRFDTS